MTEGKASPHLYRLDEVTDPIAVREAIAEYDRLGEEKFLAAHPGFGPSTTYSLLDDGKEYPPKAILSAAYAHQYPGRGPLPNNFPGGKSSTNRLLARLGFTVAPKGDAAGGREEGGKLLLVAAGGDSFEEEEEWHRDLLVPAIEARGKVAFPWRLRLGDKREVFKAWPYLYIYVGTPLQ